jgi:hypothetical protein
LAQANVLFLLKRQIPTASRRSREWLSPRPFPPVFRTAHLLCGARAKGHHRDRMIRVAVQHPLVAITFACSIVLTRINSL